MLKIAFQGEKGAYSEAAIFEYFKNKTTNRLHLIGFGLFEDVFDALTNDDVDFALVPVENSIAGSVSPVYDLLLNSKTQIIGEIFLKIEHNLLAKKGTKLLDIKTVISHWQALAQCRSFLNKNRIFAKQAYDTAGAAKLIAESLTKSKAAIASEYAAKIYDLEILASDIAINKNNFTRFLLLEKDEGSPVKSITVNKTSIAFKTKHEAGALVNCLNILSTHNINLTKIESRPIPQNPWEYVFYADLNTTPDNPNLQVALNKLKTTASFLKVLGSYHAASKSQE